MWTMTHNAFGSGNDNRTAASRVGWRRQRRRREDEIWGVTFALR